MHWFTGSPGAPVHWFTGSPSAPVHWFTGSYVGWVGRADYITVKTKLLLQLRDYHSCANAKNLVLVKHFVGDK